MSRSPTSQSSFSLRQCRGEFPGFQSTKCVDFHVLNYRYSEEEDRILPIDCMKIRVPDLAGKKIELFAPRGITIPEYKAEDTEIILQNVGLYTIIEISNYGRV